MNGPIYCHTGLILNGNGGKMSKRDRVDALRDHIAKLISSGRETTESLARKFNAAGIRF
jgi:glutamyl/glutaminyl-tRNA synthetase